MAYNKASEIKSLLLLEDENQTIDDEQIETYLSDAQEELHNEIQRNRETDKFPLKSEDLDDNEEIELVPYFVVDDIEEVRDTTNNKTISSSHYEKIRDGNAIKLKTGKDDADLNTDIWIEIDYIPKNYKLCERAIAIENILARLQPFQNEQINPSLTVWREKKKNYLKMLKSKFGTGSFY
ncbi:MAG: hypothetical protein ACOC44_10065 [Promethearchaeia archaeon]